MEWLQSEWFALYCVPLLICLARVIDVTIGTLRIIFVSKGLKYLAPILGFFEIIIWLAALSQVMSNLTNPVNFFAYALGFSLGNYLGIYMENRLAIGTVVLRIITRRDSQELVANLREFGYGVTVIDAEGNEGPVNVIFTVLRRSHIKKITSLIQKYNPRAFYSIQDVRHAKLADPLVSSPIIHNTGDKLHGVGKY